MAHSKHVAEPLRSILNAFAPHVPSSEHQATDAKADTRTCTCYPGEHPLPCPRKFALRECWRAAVLDETQGHIVRLKNQDRQPDEQALLDYLMRVRTCLEV